MEYLVYLADVGMHVFLFFQDDEDNKVGMQVFRDEEEVVRIERLADVGIKEEDVGNHLRMEPFPYFVNYKVSAP
jgi:hypothetical protein